MTLPSSRQRIRSVRITVEIRWLMSSTVMPEHCFRSMESTEASVVASRALVQSSRMRIRGFFKRARARESRCFCPPERLTPPWAEVRLRTVGKALHKGIRTGDLGRRLISSSVASGFPQAEVFGDGSGKQQRFLRNHGDFSPQLFLGQQRNIHAVYKQRSRDSVIKTGNQIYQCGFPGSL